MFDPQTGVEYYFMPHGNQIRRLPKYFKDKVDKENEVSIHVFTSEKTGRHMYQELHCKESPICSFGFVQSTAIAMYFI